MRRGHSDVAGFPMYGAGEPDWHEQSRGDDPVHRRRVRRQPDDAKPTAGSQKLAHAEKGRLQRHVVQGGHAGDEIEALTVEFGYGQGVPVEDRRLRSAGGAPIRLDGIERRRGVGGIRGSAGERIGNGHGARRGAARGAGSAEAAGESEATAGLDDRRGIGVDSGHRCPRGQQALDEQPVAAADVEDGDGAPM